MESKWKEENEEKSFNFWRFQAWQARQDRQGN
jgi:hypothetical protein